MTHLTPSQQFFTPIELGDNFQLQEVLETGSLPEVRSSSSKEFHHAFLRSYSLNYTHKEIQAEQWVKNLPPFRRFLEVAGQMNGKILNYTKIAREIGVDPNTTQSYFDILEDTLIGFRLPGFYRSIRKQQRIAPKFYFFDLGVKRALDQTLDVKLKAQTSAYGEAFEHFVITEILRICSYAHKHYKYSYLQTKDGAEIELIIERPGQTTALIEIKSKTQVDEYDIRSLKHFVDEFENPLLLLISNDENEKKFDKITACHWKNAFTKILGAI